MTPHIAINDDGACVVTRKLGKDLIAGDVIEIFGRGDRIKSLRPSRAAVPIPKVRERTRVRIAELELWPCGLTIEPHLYYDRGGAA